MIQPDPPPPNPAISATLARRLLEVADSFRNFPEVILIAKLKFPNNAEPEFPDALVYGFPTLDAANNYFRDNYLTTDEWGIFGPYPVSQNERNIKWDLKGYSHEIDTVTITVKYKDNTHEEIVFEEEANSLFPDTIFFNLSSFDKFAMPYYTKLYGVDYAKNLRDFILREFQEKGLNGSVLSALQHRISRTLLQKANNNNANQY